MASVPRSGTSSEEYINAGGIDREGDETGMRGKTSAYKETGGPCGWQIGKRVGRREMRQSVRTLLTKDGEVEGRNGSSFQSKTATGGPWFVRAEGRMAERPYSSCALSQQLNCSPRI